MLYLGSRLRAPIQPSKERVEEERRARRRCVAKSEMSARSTPSPRQGPAQPSDESQLPTGHCRFILTQSEIRGKRCGCANFSLNHTVPGASCNCGHLACYHVRTAEPPTTEASELEVLRQRVLTLERKEQDMEYLKRQVSALEDNLNREQGLVVRLSELEDAMEKSKEEFGQEIKASYRNLNRAWHSIKDLESKAIKYDSHLEQTHQQQEYVNVQLATINQRLLELDDADAALEDRVEVLENTVEVLDCIEEQPEARHPPEARPSVVRGQPRKPSVSETTPTPTPTRSVPPIQPATSVVPLRTVPQTRLWTVHISLMPTVSRPFPFERDTNAYKRCLSRGLHKMVAINGLDAESFVSAVTTAFSSLLKGRPWMPLQAQLCNAELVQGLPMLRKLEPHLQSERYDVEFLRKHCAVTDAAGNIDSLYIALTSDNFTWADLRQAPVWMDGLEATWAYDPLLDHNTDEDENDELDDLARPSAGDMIPNLPSLKRTASEMSRSSSFSTVVANEGEGTRTKVPRTHPLPNKVAFRRGVETI